MKFILFLISHTLNSILTIFCLPYLTIISQPTYQNSKTIIFVDSGKRNINRFDYINLIIVAFSFKMLSISNNAINIKIWVKRIKYEVDILRLIKLEFTK